MYPLLQNRAQAYNYFSALHGKPINFDFDTNDAKKIVSVIDQVGRQSTEYTEVSSWILFLTKTQVVDTTSRQVEGQSAYPMLVAIFKLRFSTNSWTLEGPYTGFCNFVDSYFLIENLFQLELLNYRWYQCQLQIDHPPGY